MILKIRTHTCLRPLRDSKESSKSFPDSKIEHVSYVLQKYYRRSGDGKNERDSTSNVSNFHPLERCFFSIRVAYRQSFRLPQVRVSTVLLRSSIPNSLISMDTHTSLRHRAPLALGPLIVSPRRSCMSFPICTFHRYLLPLSTEPLDTLLYITVATLVRLDYFIKKPPAPS